MKFLNKNKNNKYPDSENIKTEFSYENNKSPYTRGDLVSNDIRRLDSDIKPRKGWISKFLKPAGYMIFLSIGAAVYFNAQNISDWWTLRNYIATEEISSISSKSSFTKNAQKLFYISDPELLNEEVFSQNCQVDEQTIVLGCYVNNSKIYIFNVNDPRIEGVEEVTAAHEMLHAAYARLSTKDQALVDIMTAQALITIKDPRILKTIESYRSRDSSVVAGELHSILGTEVRSLPSELEDYYSQYFIDRGAVVALSEQYSAEFTSRELKISEFDAQLTTLNEEIKAAEISITALGSNIESERTRINSLITQPAQYNASIPGFNALVSQYNNDLQNLRSKIELYNSIVAERNNIAVEENELFEE